MMQFMQSLSKGHFPGCLKNCLPKFLRRFFFGGELLRLRRNGNIADAKRAIWSRLGNPKHEDAWLSGIIFVATVHLSWQRSDSRNDLKPVFHGRLRSEGDHVILEGRISASRFTQWFTFVILVALLGSAAVFAVTIVIPLMCALMASFILLMVKFCRHQALEDERHILRVIQEIFEDSLTESRTRGS